MSEQKRMSKSPSVCYNFVEHSGTKAWAMRAVMLSRVWVKWMSREVKPSADLRGQDLTFRQESTITINEKTKQNKNSLFRGEHQQPLCSSVVCVCAHVCMCVWLWAVAAVEFILCSFPWWGFIPLFEVACPLLYKGHCLSASQKKMTFYWLGSKDPFKNGIQ